MGKGLRHHGDKGEEVNIEERRVGLRLAGERCGRSEGVEGTGIDCGWSAGLN